MGNCKDCKYWESHQDMRGKVWTTCERVDLVNSVEEIGDDGAGVLVEISDDYGLMAGLRTGPMFGCVKFKGNE